jgi:topoisomerase-4 subunit A
MRTLERIFIEERIYKKIEKQKTSEGVIKSVISGFSSFKAQLLRPIKKEDVERLLKIPIRRISLFDISKNEMEIDAIHEALKLCQYRLDNIIEYSISYIEDMRKLVPKDRLKRKTIIKNIEAVNIKDVAQRDKDLKYNAENGYLGYNLKDGECMLKISIFDKIVVVTKDGHYRFLVNPEKEYVGKGLLYCGYADKEALKKVTFSLIMQQKTYKYLFVKRFQIKSGQLNKEYCLLPDVKTYKVVKLSMLENAEIRVVYKPKPGLRVKEESFYLSDYLIKGAFTKGTRLTVKEVKSLRMRPVKEVEKKDKDLFDLD